GSRPPGAARVDRAGTGARTQRGATLRPRPGHLRLPPPPGERPSGGCLKPGDLLVLNDTRVVPAPAPEWRAARGSLRPTAPQCPGTVECPSPLTPPRSFRLRKGTAPPPVNCGSVPFHRSIALFWMSNAVSDSCRSLFASACALALTSVACASPSASATFAFASVCWRCNSYSACWAC